MKGTPAIYLGRIVEKKNFRTFVYGPNGEKKIVESWDAYEAAMQSGIWFATVEDAKAINAVEDVIEKPKSKPRSRAKPKTDKVEEVDESESVLPDDGSVFEVTDAS